MTSMNNRALPLVGIPLALIAGFALARLTGGHSGEPGHSENTGHAENKPVSAARAVGSTYDDKHGDADAHADEGAHAESDTGEQAEGVVPLTQAQIVASGIDVVAGSRGAGGETRVSGRA